MYEERTYRDIISRDGLVKSVVAVGESDLCILAGYDLSARARDLLLAARHDIERYAELDGKFKATLGPYRVPDSAPRIVRDMAKAAARFNVGPMAAVAGAVAEYVGSRIQGDVIVENGGDIYARSREPVTVSLYAGPASKFTGRVRFKASSGGRSVGIATSSGTVGHSFSFGKADAVCVISDSAIDADAAATSFCNMVRKEDDIGPVLEKAAKHGNVKGIIIAIGEKLGAKGAIEFI